MLWSQFSAIFCQYSAKNGVSSKTNIMITFSANLPFVWVKNADFLANFSQKKIKNHNIGPILGEFSPNGCLFTLGDFLKLHKDF
jgi:hypothetical protein